jgi:hypothetical protein
MAGRASIVMHIIRAGLRQGALVMDAHWRKKVEKTIDKLKSD